MYVRPYVRHVRKAIRKTCTKNDNTNIIGLILQGNRTMKYLNISENIEKSYFDDTCVDRH